MRKAVPDWARLSLLYLFRKENAPTAHGGQWLSIFGFAAPDVTKPLADVRHVCRGWLSTKALFAVVLNPVRQAGYWDKLSVR